MAKLR
jgi:hypothetical protein